MKRVSCIIVVSLLTLGLVGCGGGNKETATPEAEVESTPMVSVTGEVMPAKWSNLSIQTAGTVIEVLVEPGDEVAEGDLLVRLDPVEAQLAVQQAEAALANAQAQVALLEARPRPKDVASAEQQVEVAEATLSQAVAQRDQLRAGTLNAEIAAAQAEVAGAEAAHKDAQLRYDDVQDQDVYEWKKEKAGLEWRAAEQALEAAQVRLAQLQRSIGARTEEADAVVEAAAAQKDVSLAQLTLIQAGATAEEIAVAYADVAQAQVDLDAARVALERCELHAPFDGTVGAVNVRTGELVALGDSLVTLGDLTSLQVETTDLDEIDVAHVDVGSLAAVTFDSLPERTFTGRATRISPMADPGAGGVNYTVIIEMEELGPTIRWGMTAFVDIEVEQ
jgi:multidrug resistance efflux pump